MTTTDDYELAEDENDVLWAVWEWRCRCGHFDIEVGEGKSREITQ